MLGASAPSDVSPHSPGSVHLEDGLEPMRRLLAFGTLCAAVTLGLTSCSSLKLTNTATGPPAISFAIAVPQQNGQASTGSHLIRMSTSSTYLRPVISTKQGDSTLIVTAVEAVFKEMELQRASATSDCTVTPTGQSSDSDQCDEFNLGPIVSDFPIQTPGNSTRVAIGFAQKETYSSFWFRLHRLDPNDANDASLINQRPELQGASVYVSGTFNGTAFKVGISAEQTEKLTFKTPVVLGDGSQLGLGVTLDVLSWFKDPATGQLIDPTAVASSDSLQALVAGNIASSLSLQVTQL